MLRCPGLVFLYVDLVPCTFYLLLGLVSANVIPQLRLGVPNSCDWHLEAEELCLSQHREPADVRRTCAALPRAGTVALQWTYIVYLTSIDGIHIRLIPMAIFERSILARTSAQHRMCRKKSGCFCYPVARTGCLLPSTGWPSGVNLTGRIHLVLHLLLPLPPLVLCKQDWLTLCAKKFFPPDCSASRIKV